MPNRPYRFPLLAASGGARITRFPQSTSAGLVHDSLFFAAQLTAISGMVNVTMPSFTLVATATISGASSINGSASFEMPGMTVVATGKLAIAATASVTMPSMTVQATGALPINATANFMMPPMSASGAGSLINSAVASFEMPGMVFVASGKLNVSASASFAMPAFTLVATGTLSLPAINAVANFEMPGFVVSGTAEIITPKTGGGGNYRQWRMPQRHSARLIKKAIDEDDVREAARLAQKAAQDAIQARDAAIAAEDARALNNIEQDILKAGAAIRAAKARTELERRAVQDAIAMFSAVMAEIEEFRRNEDEAIELLLLAA